MSNFTANTTIPVAGHAGNLPDARYHFLLSPTTCAAPTATNIPTTTDPPGPTNTPGSMNTLRRMATPRHPR